MSSTYSPLLRIELIGTGDQSGIWGNTTNTNLGTLIEQAIAGSASVNVAAGNVTLTELNGASDQSRCAILNVTGSPGVSRNIVAPASSKTYIVVNGSDSSVVLKTSGSTGLTIPTGATVTAAYNGSDFVAIGQPYDADLAAIAALSSTGLIARTGSGTAAVRSVAASGSGISITNGDGVSGNPTVTSNATATNTVSTLVFRDGSGNFSAGTITASLSGNMSGGSVNATTGDFSGAVTGASFSATSDARLKSNVVTLGHALDTVKSLRGVSYVKNGAAELGLIAQEVQTTLPQVVGQTADGYLTVAYGNIVAVLVEAVKELADKVAQLEAKNG